MIRIRVDVVHALHSYIKVSVISSSCLVSASIFLTLSLATDDIVVLQNIN